MEFPLGRLDLYLTEIGEPLKNQLRIVLWEANAGDLTNIIDGDFVVEGVRPLEITNQSRCFEIFWENYVAYAVQNESYWDKEDGEPDFVNHLTQRHDSALARYVSATTFANDDYPGPLQHWALTTLNHCVDVIGTDPPKVQLIDSRMLPGRQAARIS